MEGSEAVINDVADAVMSEEEKVAKSYLVDLGLNWDQLKGKMVLDLGAGSAGFARTAKSHGVEVISLDKFPGGMGKTPLPKDVPYIISEASVLPLPDSSVDMIVSRAVIHALEKEELTATLKEARRVLKLGGEFRFGPGLLSAAIFAKEGNFDGQDDFNPSDAVAMDARLKQIADLSINYLKSVDPNIDVMPGNPKREKYNDTYYILRKTL